MLDASTHHRRERLVAVGCVDTFLHLVQLFPEADDVLKPSAIMADASPAQSTMSSSYSTAFLIVCPAMIIVTSSVCLLFCFR